MNAVTELQNVFQCALLECDPAPGLFVHEGAPERGGFDLYINAYSARLVAALKDNYPVLFLALGDEAFTELASVYLAQRPSRFRSIRWFGDGLREFLDENPDRLPHPALADLASMDWALRAAFDAGDAQVLHAADLATVAPEHWPQMSFSLHPSVALLDLGWRVEPIWHALNEDTNAQTEEPAAHAHTLLVWRQALECKWRAIGIPEALALQGVAQGYCFAEVCAALAMPGAGDPVNEPSALAALLLNQWLVDGFLVKDTGLAD